MISNNGRGNIITGYKNPVPYSGRTRWQQIGHPPEYSQYQEQVDPVVEKLEQIERYGHSRYDIFNDWLDLMLYSLQEDDENYLGVVDKYDNDMSDGQRPVDLYAEAFGELQYGIAETEADLLGVVYEELGMDSDQFGQYFTPHNLCRLKADMVIDVDEDRDDPYTVADPASGSGRLLLHAAKSIPDDVDAVFYGKDKDATCAKMTALNLCMFNLDGYAVHGDSLTLDRYRVWRTRATPFGGEIGELAENEYPTIKPEPRNLDDSASALANESGDAGCLIEIRMGDNNMEGE